MSGHGGQGTTPGGVFEVATGRRRSTTCCRRGRCRRCRSPCTSRSSASGSPSRRWCCFAEWLLSAHRRRALPDAGAALDAGDGRAVRRRRRHRHDPSFEMGLLWPSFTGDVRQRVRARLRGRGLLVLPGGDLHRHLRLRLEPALAARALRERHPDRDRRLHRLADGDLRQRLDEPPDRLPPRATARPSTSIRCEALFGNTLLLARARAHVPRRLHGHRLPRGRAPTPFGAAARHAGAATSGRRSRSRSRSRRWPRSLQVLVGDWSGREVAAEPADQAGRVRGARPHDRRARPCTSSAGTTDGEVRVRDPDPATCSRCSPSTIRTRPCRGSTRSPPDDRPPVNVVRVRLPDDGRDRHAARAARRRLPRRSHAAAAAARVGLVLPRARRSAGPLSVVALIAGWVTTEVGRQPWVVYHVMRTSQAVTGAGGIPVGYATLAAVYLALGDRSRLGARAPRPGPLEDG